MFILLSFDARNQNRDQNSINRPNLDCIYLHDPEGVWVSTSRRELLNDLSPLGPAALDSSSSYYRIAKSMNVFKQTSSNKLNS